MIGYGPELAVRVLQPRTMTFGDCRKKGSPLCLICSQPRRVPSLWRVSRQPASEACSCGRSFEAALARAGGPGTGAPERTGRACADLPGDARTAAWRVGGWDPACRIGSGSRSAGCTANRRKAGTDRCWAVCSALLGRLRRGQSGRSTAPAVPHRSGLTNHRTTSRIYPGAAGPSQPWRRALGASEYAVGLDATDVGTGCLRPARDQRGLLGVPVSGRTWCATDALAGSGCGFGTRSTGRPRYGALVPTGLHRWYR